MQIYMVGGAVRDALLGLPVKDRDWVVVGSTPEELVALGDVPVGRAFPVFLHPVTREDYALARTCPFYASDRDDERPSVGLGGHRIYKKQNRGVDDIQHAQKEIKRTSTA